MVIGIVATHLRPRWGRYVCTITSLPMFDPAGVGDELRNHIATYTDPAGVGFCWLWLPMRDPAGVDGELGNYHATHLRPRRGRR